MKASPKDLYFLLLAMTLSIASMYWHQESADASSLIAEYQRNAEHELQFQLNVTRIERKECVSKEEIEQSAIRNSKERNVVLVVYDFGEKLVFNSGFFLRHGIFNSEFVDFVIVGNATAIRRSSDTYFDNACKKFPNLHFVSVETKASYFCLWKAGIDQFLDRRPYTHLILVNRDLRGPFLPAYFKGTWIDALLKILDANVGVAGTSAQCLKRKGFENDLPSPFTEYPDFRLHMHLLAMDRRAFQYYTKQLSCSLDATESGIKEHEILATKGFVFEAGSMIKPISNQWRHVNMNISKEVSIACQLSPRDPWFSLGELGDNVAIHPLETIFVRTDKYFTQEMQKLTEYQDKYFEHVKHRRQDVM